MRPSNKSEMPGGWFDKQMVRYHLANDPKTKGIADQIRRVIGESGKTRYRIAVEIGIDHGTMSRFMNGKGKLATDQLDPLAELLDWTIIAETKPPASRRRKLSEGK